METFTFQKGRDNRPISFSESGKVVLPDRKSNIQVDETWMGDIIEKEKFIIFLPSKKITEENFIYFCDFKLKFKNGEVRAIFKNFSRNLQLKDCKIINSNDYFEINYYGKKLNIYSSDFFQIKNLPEKYLKMKEEKEKSEKEYEKLRLAVEEKIKEIKKRTPSFLEIEKIRKENIKIEEEKQNILFDLEKKYQAEFALYKKKLEKEMKKYYNSFGLELIVEKEAVLKIKATAWQYESSRMMGSVNRGNYYDENDYDDLESADSGHETIEKVVVSDSNKEIETIKNIRHTGCSYPTLHWEGTKTNHAECNGILCRCINTKTKEKIGFVFVEQKEEKQEEINEWVYGFLFKKKEEMVKEKKEFLLSEFEEKNYSSKKKMIEKQHQPKETNRDYVDVDLETMKILKYNKISFDFEEGDFLIKDKEGFMKKKIIIPDEKEMGEIEAEMPLVF